MSSGIAPENWLSFAQYEILETEDIKDPVIPVMTLDAREGGGHFLERVKGGSNTF